MLHVVMKHLECPRKYGRRTVGSLVLVADLSDGTTLLWLSEAPVLEGCQAKTLEDPLGESAEMILPDS